MSEQLHFWQYCDIARCLPSSPDDHLRREHRQFHKHPQRHELRAAWVVERAKQTANTQLDLEAVTEASRREERDYENADKHTITTLTIRL